MVPLTPATGIRFSVPFAPILLKKSLLADERNGPVARLVGIKGGVVSGVFNLESSSVEALDWRPRHDEQYDEA